MTTPHCSTCGRFMSLHEKAPEGESGDIYACSKCDLGACDECDGTGVYYINRQAQACICSEDQS